MTEPYSEHEAEFLDAIEDQLMEKNVPFPRMMKMYAEFLRNCILAGRFNEAASSAQLDSVAEHLQVAIVGLGHDNSDELRRPHRIELWTLFDCSEKENPALAALIRCAVCCFYDEAGWDPDTSESVTPMPLYLFLLKRIIPTVGVEFLKYAQRSLLGPSLSE
ncbi:MULTISPECIES: hypothetical protein [unclassified Variovorax]|jgi:hypothetical protein|uniref:hypothetical protein n=1 Tax=unclassified Variovorax TaxID=663243 RepID=UPI000B8146F5|nr:MULTISPECIES: hypothetical protein [unclassified Variovorax]